MDNSEHDTESGFVPRVQRSDDPINSFKADSAKINLIDIYSACKGVFELTTSPPHLVMVIPLKF